MFVSGRVQGVCYRAETWRTARKFDLTGWVRNLRDGRVEAVFEGDESGIKEMIDWCRQGPILATVTEIEIIEEPSLRNFTDFSIKY